ncbi:MAG: glucose-6-phosphate isomerase [Actinobacteria bacterium]|nr:glucose-6-phosphate isomerase [Actinomycetota bacterium]
MTKNYEKIDKVKPFKRKLDFTSCDFNKYDIMIIRKLSDIASIFTDQKKSEEMQESSDPVIYTVGEIKVPNEDGHLSFGISKIYPGKIGNEFYMTKGHHHKSKDGSEIYICVEGKGYLIIQSKGQVINFYMNKGSVVYVPPGWAHRTVNCGKGFFSCLYFMPANAGHDYESIKKNDFKIRIVELDKKICLIEK